MTKELLQYVLLVINARVTGYLIENHVPVVAWLVGKHFGADTVEIHKGFDPQLK